MTLRFRPQLNRLADHVGADESSVSTGLSGAGRI
jgi:hypothetical protein